VFVYLLSWSMFSQYASGEWQKNVAHGLGNYVHHAKGQVGLQGSFIRNLSNMLLSLVLDYFGTIPFCRWEWPCCFRLPNTQVNGTRTCNMVSASGDPEGSIFEIAISVAEFEGKRWCMFWCNSCWITMCTIYKHNISWNEETNYWPLPTALVKEILSSLLGQKNLGTANRHWRIFNPSPFNTRPLHHEKKKFVPIFLQVTINDMHDS